jgi:hypothetical protein
MVHRVQVREISNDEGNRLLRIVRRSSGSVVTWRRAQMVLLSAQGMPVAKIAEVTFTSPDRVRDVLPNLTADGFDALYPATPAAGRPSPVSGSGRRSSRSRFPGRETMTCPSQRGAWRGWPIPWLPRGWSTTFPTKSCAHCSRRGRQPSRGEDLQGQLRP